jgi:hypothetical protein
MVVAAHARDRSFPAQACRTGRRAFDGPNGLIPAQSSARVEKIALQSGAMVCKR